MSEQNSLSSEAGTALILITFAHIGPDRVRAFLRRSKIRVPKGGSVSDAILAHYRTARGFDMRRLAVDLDLTDTTVPAEIAA